MKKLRFLSILLAISAGSLALAQNITGAGATFPYPIYSKWFSEYSAAHSGVQINYQSIGSGAGIRQVTAGTVDFGAADVPMTDAQLASSKVKIVHIPTVLGAVVPIFNVKGVKDLRIRPRRSRRHLPRQNHFLERPAHRQRQSRSQPAK